MIQIKEISMPQNKNVNRRLGRRLIGVLITLIVVGGLWPEYTLAEPLVQAVGPIEITVSDLERSVAFYEKVLSFEKVSEGEVHGQEYEHLQGIFGLRMRQARLQLGREMVVLTDYLAPQGGRPIPVDSRSNDGWFQHIAIIVSDMDRAYQHLRQHRVQHASTGPQTIPAWNTAAGGIKAFYFRDPDHHNLEILWFPPGKGHDRWQRKDELFLGIDHTAIVVADTEKSLGFYRDTLGMNVVGESENYGIEQERLNNVFGARLRITALRAEAGPAIEFLEYLAPRDGRPYPADSKANDIWHWQIHLISRSPGDAFDVLRSGTAPFVSSGPTALPNENLGFNEGLLIRDPDGHALLLRP
jgi:catechol 2,3-dioxygenase-like lactoylglutathione lyase family enzyme